MARYFLDFVFCGAEFPLASLAPYLTHEELTAKAARTVSVLLLKDPKAGTP